MVTTYGDDVWLHGEPNKANPKDTFLSFPPPQKKNVHTLMSLKMSLKLYDVFASACLVNLSPLFHKCIE